MTITPMKTPWEKYLVLMAQRPGEFRNNGPICIVSDRSTVEEFENKTGVVIGVRYESDYHYLVVDLVRGEDGKLFAYERVLSRASGAAVVCVPRWDDRFVLLRQYRHALRDYQYAFPRGFGEDGLSGAENAAKEVREELGVETEKTVFLGKVAADSGLSSCVSEVYLCELRELAQTVNTEGIVAIKTVTAQELTEMIGQGLITDGFTLAACSFLRAGNA